MNDRRVFQRVKVDVVPLLTLSAALLAAIGAVWFGLNRWWLLAVALGGLAVDFPYMLWRFRAERREVMQIAPSVPKETVVVQRASPFPLLRYPRLLLQRGVGGLHFQGIGEHQGAEVSVPWGDITSIDVRASNPPTISISFHEGGSLRLAPESGEVPALVAWLRGEAEFPEASSVRNVGVPK
jgi:hypothetical protein